MDAVTYPHPRVREALASMVPVKVSFTQQSEVAGALGAVWTPTFQFRTPDDRLVRASTGYLEPEAFLVELALGEAMVAFAERRYADAEAACLRAAREAAVSPQTPEALYWLAVARYRATGRGEALKEGWNELLDRYPGTLWAMKASFIREPAPSEGRRAG